MLKTYRTVKEFGQNEIVIEKSTFIGYAKPVTDEDEALAFIQEIKKKHRDATHNVPAYVLGEHNDIQRCNDDGEPSGTAGVPVLEVLKKEDVRDVAVVVTRYFGGTLLGTGGLVRAYSAATKEGLANSTIITKYWGTKLLVNTDYNDIGKLQYLFGQREIPIMDAQYTEKVSFVVLIPVSRVEEIKKAVTEAVSGRAGMEEVEQLFYALIDGEYICF